jgi:hypothetical protein
MRQRLRTRFSGAVVLGLALAGAAAGADVAPLLARIKAVGREGAGNAEAGKAWRELARAGPDDLPAILAGLDDADPTAANWIRAAVDAIAERTLAAGRPLPADKLEAFVKDREHAGPARRLAYEWLVRADPKAPERLLPGMLQDPSAELRRDAVAVVLNEAQARLDAGNKEDGTATYRKALSGAVDKDQVDLCVERLKALGVTVDLAAHFGFVRRWMLVAPFDNSGEAGFAVAYPPEKGVDLATAYKGKSGAEARWAEHTTADPYGVVDLNKLLGRQKGTIAYAFAVIDSPAERPVQVRAGCINAVKIFLNGKQVLNCEEYHHGMIVDQYVAMGTLKPGRNEVLVKVCQNEQTEVWAQEWKFQVRFCDEAGAAVPFTVVTEKGQVRP